MVHDVKVLHPVSAAVLTQFRISTSGYTCQAYAPKPPIATIGYSRIVMSTNPTATTPHGPNIVVFGPNHYSDRYLCSKILNKYYPEG